MDYVRTFENIYLSDIAEVGERAVDLATLRERHFDVPLGFVIHADALEEFIEYNNLEERGERWLQNRDYATLVEQTTKGDYPDPVKRSIREAYASLAVDEGSAQDVITGSEDVNVTIIPSPNYTTENHAIKADISGTDNVIQSVKEAWASLMTRDEFHYRQARSITEFYAGAIVLQTSECEASATASTRPDKDYIVVKTRHGRPDFTEEITTDEFHVDKATLTIDEHQINEQKEKRTTDERVTIGRGKEQAVDDKTVIELGRLTKKMSNQLEEGMTAHYLIDDDITLLFADRMLMKDWFDLDRVEEPALDEDQFAGELETEDENHPQKPLLDRLQRKVDELEEFVLDEEPYERELAEIEDILRELRT